MKTIIYSILFVLLTGTQITTLYAQNNDNSFEGRWNITINENGNYVSSWLEIRPWGYTNVGAFLHTGGLPRPISEINTTDDHFNFAIPWNFENEILKVDGVIKNDKLQGDIYYPNGEVYKWTGVRSPELPYVKNPIWGAPIELFNGENLNGWHTNGENQWIVESGVLKSPKAGSNIISDQEFMDFKLHIEFRYPKHGNSGVYLRGRYEVQISDDKGKSPSNEGFSSVFGFLEPNEMVAKNAGEWQTFDITLVGRRVTIEANGVTIINDQQIPAITGGAMSVNESDPGPFVLQGDHHPIEYRNIIVTPRVTGSN